MPCGQRAKLVVANAADSRHQILFIVLAKASLQHFTNGGPFASAQFRSLTIAYYAVLGPVPGTRRFDQRLKMMRPVAWLNPKKSKESERPGFLINVIFEVKNSFFGPPQPIEGADVVGITF